MLGSPQARSGALTRFLSVGLPVLLACVIALTPSAASAHLRRHHVAHNNARHFFTGATDPNKDAALIIDGETGKVLYQRNSEATRHPASLTKMMTLYLLFDAMQKGQVTLSTPLKVSYHASVQKPTKLYLKPGDTITVDQAIKAIVVRSANDVAVTIAEGLGGTESNFAAMMNAKARQFGMTGTYYHNASGLPDPQQISTAKDLAVLARHLAYDYPQYFHYFSTPSFTFRGVTYQTHDNLIGRYNGADGIKTGYTGASGFNLVSSVVRNGVHIIGVVMGGVTAHRRDNEMMNLLDQTFAQVQRNPTLVARAEIPWQRVADNSPSTPVVAGFELPGVTARAQQPSNATAALNALSQPPVNLTDMDEDTAENAADPNDGEGDIAGDNAPAKPAAIAATPAPAKPDVKAPAPVIAAVVHPVVQPAPRPEEKLASIEPDKMMKAAAVPLQIAPAGARAWTIQIGAFANTQKARSELASYAEKSMDVLGQAERIIVPFKGMDGHTLYRARFGPFVEREAREVCARLTQRGQTCFAALASR